MGWFSTRKYKGCVNCGNGTTGDEIYRCGKCGLVFCSGCFIAPGLISSAKCPKCSFSANDSATKKLGEIE